MDVTPSVLASSSPRPRPAATPGSIAHEQTERAERAERAEATVRAFTRSGSGPRATFPLVLLSVAVAAVAMDVDAVARYSRDAFLDGLVLTVFLAIAVGTILHRIPTPRGRVLAALFLPTIFGAAIGMLVQEIVLRNVGDSWFDGVKDLGGLVDTSEPGTWIASGIVLGGVPAILVSTFLLLAGRALRRLTGHDASESFGVGFTGTAGLFASVGLVAVSDEAKAPLLLIAIASAITLVVTIVVDGARIRFLRHAYAGEDGTFEIAPASAFAADPSLAPLVAAAGATAVLVRVDKQLGSYRTAAAQPIGLVAESEEDTLRPIQRRRIAAYALLLAMMVLSVVAGIARLA